VVVRLDVRNEYALATMGNEAAGRGQFSLAKLVICWRKAGRWPGYAFGCRQLMVQATESAPRTHNTFRSWTLFGFKHTIVHDPA
jgi:hypothetical protein